MHGHCLIDDGAAQVPFKLTRELLEVMDSNPDGKASEIFDYFKVWCCTGLRSDVYAGTPPCSSSPCQALMTALACQPACAE